MALQLSLNTLTTSILAEIEKARLQGVDVGAHIYNFTVAGPELRSLLQNPSTAISLTQHLRDDKGLTLERAIQKLAGLPAARLSLKERGTLRRGIPADILVFNSPAPSSGLKYVFVNGTLALKDGQPTEARSGQALR